MSSGLTLDTSKLEAAALFVEREVGRDCAESLNRAALSAIIGSGSGPGAMQLTPKADKGVIEALPYKKVAGYVARKLRKKGLLGKGKGKTSNKQFRNNVRYEKIRRKKASGYAAYAGYNKAAKAFGGRGIGKGVNKEFEASEAARGRGKKASVGDLLAEIVNTAPAAERIGFEALQEGVNNAALDLIAYADKKMAQTFAKVNA